MASTGKTKNLGLCQWEATDPFLREDFNEVMRKIDAAFDRDRLFAVTVTGPTPSILMEFSGVDINDYAELEVRFSLSDSYARYMRVNGVSDTKYIYYYTGGSQNKNSVDVYSGRYRLIAQDRHLSFKSVNGGNYFSMDRSVFPSINSLTFFGSSTTSNFAVGDVITVWGLRK